MSYSLGKVIASASRSTDRHDGRLPPDEAILVALTAARALDQPTRMRRGGSEDMLRFFAKHSTAFPFLSFDFSSVDEMEGHKKVTHARGLRRAIMRARLDPVTLELDRRIDWVSRACSLSPIETAILSVCVRVKLYSGWQQFQRAVEEDHTSSTRSSFIELVTGFPDSSVREALRSGSKLLRTGLIEEHCDGQFAASEVVCRIARSAGEMAQHWEEELLSRAPPSSLAWEDFTHIQGRDLAEALVRGALDTGAGANLLLYGIPGTGKSEFARALADRLEMTAHFVGETDDEGGEPTRRERLAHFSLVRALVPPGARRLIVVDEAEDVMLPPSGDERVNASKLWLNQLIESTRTPIIWIVNDIDKLTAPVIRRMSLALRFELPPRGVRERVASRHAQTLGLNLETKEQQQLAAMPVSPAVAANALTVAKRTDGSIATAIAAAQSVQRALGDRQPLSRIDDAVFDPALSVADIDLTLLTRKIASLDDHRWSMLLSGPSGTGKSAYARHVATACGLELMEKRGSDLLSMFVGGTEAAIAAMFEQAVDANAVLIIDEIDSFLRDRRTASAWWDVSMVNELLSWMEAHPLPVIASTNFADMLDVAVARRFLFKVHFSSLDRQRARELYRRSFALDPPDALDAIDGMVPSDYTLVARRMRIMGQAEEPAILSMLRAEVDSRAAKSLTVGFAVGA